MKKAIIFSSVILAFSTLTGCASQPTTPQAMMTQPGIANDGAITQQVQHVLATTYPALANNLQVSTHDGRVSLKGYVNDPAEMASVINSVRHIQGVNLVINGLVIKKPFYHTSTY